MNAIEPIEAAEPPRRRGRRKGEPLQRRSYEPTFRQRDVWAAIKGAKKAGLGKFRVDIDKEGRISLVPMAPDDLPGEKGEQNEWDTILPKPENSD